MKLFSLVLMSAALGGTASASIISFDFGANDANATVNSPAGTIAGTSFIKVNAVSTVTGIDTTYGTLALNLRRGDNTESVLSVRWNQNADAFGTFTPPVGSILAGSPGVYGDTVRNGDNGRTLGLRLNGLTPGIYEILATLNAPSSIGSGRNVAIGIFSGTMPTETLISNLSQVSLASWDHYTASLAAWVPSTAATVENPQWNVLRAVVTVSSATDWVVLHLENGASGNAMGISSLQVQAIPEPSTFAALLGALALGFIAFRRRR